MSTQVILTDDQIAKNKQIIIDTFLRSVKGKKSDTILSNAKHDGKEGHWLERQMGLTVNGNNSPDFLGFEMKNDTTSKTTFGDWSADYYIFKDTKYGISRDDFLKIFGKPNAKKKGRYSWSGEPCPTIKGINKFGQVLAITPENDIVAVYYFSKDARADKHTIVPMSMQKEGLIIARWFSASIKKKLERKFNQNGWFKCVKDREGYYVKIVFGEPMNYENWLELVKSGEVFFDSGMYQTNNRPYSQWRANNALWSSLITSSY